MSEHVTEPVPSQRGRALKIGLAVAVLALFVTLLASGQLRNFSLARTAEMVRSFGPWGIAVYLLAFSFVQPLGVSGHTFTIAAALVWPPWLAFPLALLGALGSAMTNVAFARYVAFDWVQARIPARVRRYEKWLVERGLYGVILFRLFTFTLHPAQLLIGVLGVPWRRLIVGTLIGFAPSVAVDVLLGGELLRALAGWLGVA
jgi:uncharacterized membrane protein YdjX (TVP38/TMEM64 family)